jgi:sensor histidine kinase regulating citrate/malate metabolism
MDAHRADNPSDCRQVAIRMQCTGRGKVEVVVSDSGPGIPEKVIDEIFDTFYTTRPDGTGLGLSIARTIVDMYGGKIWAENCAQGEAAFHFIIPLRPRDNHAKFNSATFCTRGRASLAKDTPAPLGSCKSTISWKSPIAQSLI